jgi:tripartite-type tricarboxylate transporter receptor subunit TctC
MAQTQPISRRTFGVALTAASGLLARPGLAQTSDWPQRPVRVIVPLGAGGATDTLARTFTQRLAGVLGQPFPVENRPGGNTSIGAEAALRAPRDGYTLMFCAAGAIMATPRLQALSYDPQRDFVGVSVIGTNSSVVTVGRDFPARTFAEFVDHARANPGRLNAGNTGNGTSSHLAAVMVAVHARLDLVTVPYQGVPQLLADLIANRIQLHVGNPVDMIPQMQSGNVRILAATGASRMRQLPDVPAVAESFPGAAFVGWNGFFAPTGTPTPVIEKLSQAIGMIAREPDVAQRLDDLAIDPFDPSPEAAKALIARENPVYEQLLRSVGLLRAG